MIPIAQPQIGDEECEAVEKVLRSGMLARGEVCRAFEEEFASSCGAFHAVGVNSGTAALHTALLALGIGPGDEVIVPAFSFIASATAVSMCGANPVMADVDEKTFTLQPGEINRLANPNTKAVIAVHLFGQACNMDVIVGHSACSGLKVVEDCAQAHGALYKGRPVGSIGDAGCFSFYPTKNMTTGEGGMITTNDSALAEEIRTISDHGQSEKYLHTRLGYNYRMTDIAAAIGRVQLQKLPSFTAARRRNADYFNSHIKREGIVCPFVPSENFHVYHQYVVRVEESFGADRDSLMAYLQEKGIGSAVHYPMPIHRQPLYEGDGKADSCPVAEGLGERVLSLPVHPGVSEEDCRTICDAINGSEDLWR